MSIPKPVMREVVALLPTTLNPIIVSKTGVSQSVVTKLRTKLGILSPQYVRTGRPRKQVFISEEIEKIKVAVPKKRGPVEVWPCNRGHDEWPTCGHHLTCASGPRGTNRCTAPGY
jgi:hypothetical protein